MTQVLGRYELIEELGRGAMGVVYKAHDPVLGRIVAIKTLSSDADDDEIRNRLVREAAAAARLKHPNIITVHDFGEEQGIPYIALEFLEGIDLKQLIRNKIDLYAKEKIGILRQIALGLGHAHKQGVVHRDVKPANIRILRDGTVKIMDFGIARLASSQLTRAGTVLGSVDYMSPEQVEAKRVDHRCDMFSFGVVAYEMVGGMLPFKGDNMPATMHKILQTEPPKIPDESFAPFPELEGLIGRCLQKDPARRFEHFQEIARNLDAIALELKPEKGERAQGDLVSEAPSPDQSTVIMTDRTDTRAEGPWQAGDETVSGIELWVGTDRFQKINAKLEKVQAQRPKPPVKIGSVSAGRAASLPTAAPARSTPDESTSKGRSRPQSRPAPTGGTYGRAVLLGALVALAVIGILSIFVLNRGDDSKDSATGQLHDFAEARLSAADARLAAGDFQGAIDELERILEVAPDHEAALARRTEIETRRDQRFEELLDSGRGRIEAGDLRGATETLSAALALKPDDPETSQLLEETGRRLTAQRSASEQREQLDELLASGRQSLSAGRVSQAITSLEAALELAPDNAEVRSLLDRARQQEDRRAQADRAYRAGVAAMGREDYAEAVTQLERAVELDGDNDRAREQLAGARREQARPRYGILTVNALPFGEAFLDGKSLGTTPVRLEQVPAGRHTVKVVKDGYRDFTRTLEVSEGDTTNVVAQLQKTP